jgi:hypothetical protein
METEGLNFKDLYLVVLDIFNLKLFLDKYMFFVVCFLLGNFSASEFYMPTFQNTLSVLTS